MTDPGEDAQNPKQASGLSDYMGFGHDVVGDERLVTQQQQEKEEFLRSCMARAGFEYFPGAPDGVSVPTIDGVADIGGEEANDEAWAKNREYRASLSEEQEALYWETYHGLPHNREGLTAEEVAELDTDGDGETSFEEVSGGSCIGDSAEIFRSQSPYYAAEVIGEDTVLAFHKAIDRAVVTSGATDSLVECVDDAIGIAISRENIVASLMDSEELRARPGVQECVEDYKRGVAEAREEIDARFLDEHRAIIERHGILREPRQ